MKEYRLVAWPELRPPHDRTVYRRMLSDMSHRHLTVWQLVAASGLRRPEVQGFIDFLRTRDLVIERERRAAGLHDTLAPMLAWLQRTWQAAARGD
jgi:predicted transcriptional regulator